jgi:putative redox protein
MEANITWSEGLRFQADADGPASVTIAGKDPGAAERMEISPLELVLMGLAGCTAADVISILKKKRQDVTAFSVRASAAQAEEHPRVFTRVHITYRVVGHGVEAAAVERSIELSEDKYCPAIAMLERSVTIDHSYEIVEAP